MAAAIYGAKRVAVVGTVQGIEVVNVFNVASDFSVASVANGVGNAFAETFKPYIADDYSFGFARAIDMSSATGDAATYDLSTHETGGGAGAVELGLSAVIGWNDTISGRKFRPGRTFLGPVPGNGVNAPGLFINVAYKALLANAAEDFLSALQTNISGELVIVHGMGTVDQQLAVVTSASVSELLGHLDSRRS